MGHYWRDKTFCYLILPSLALGRGGERRRGNRLTCMRREYYALHRYRNDAKQTRSAAEWCDVIC